MKYIVSDKHKFVYFVVQKVACTSIKNALLPLIDDDLGKKGSASESGSFGFDIHKYFDGSEYQINKRQFVKGLDDRYRDFFKFAFVRNPWDRLVSCYLDKLAKGRPGLHSPPSLAAKVYPGMPFAEFVEIVSQTSDSEANIHFKSQCAVICDSDDGIPDGKQIMADFIGRFESLASDFDTVMERVGVGRVQRIPHLRKSKAREARPYPVFYDDRLRTLVYQRYKDDVDLFGYYFE